MTSRKPRTVAEIFSDAGVIKKAAEMANEAQRATYEKAIKLELLTTLKEQVEKIDLVDKGGHWGSNCYITAKQKILTLISNLEKEV